MPIARGLSLLAAVVFLPGSLLGAQPTNQLTTGMTRASVIAIKGPPTGSIRRGATETLLFEDASVLLRNGRVADAEMLTPEQLARKKAADHAPAPSVPVAPPSPASSDVNWETDFATASAGAASSGRYLLLDFTGSDWCGWCKKLDAEVFNGDEFKALASQKLVCVRLDFPRHASQSAELRRQNKELSDEYGVNGYPTIVVLSPKGEFVGQQVGYGQQAQEYLDGLRGLIADYERKHPR